GRILSAALDVETPVAAVARLAVPKLAAWCSVDLVVDGELRQIALEHVDPDKVAWAKELGKKYPTSMSDPQGVPEVIRTGQPQLIAKISDEMIVAGAKDPEHLRILRSLELRTALIVPLAARGRTLGALTLVGTDPNHPF